VSRKKKRRQQDGAVPAGAQADGDDEGEEEGDAPPAPAGTTLIAPSPTPAPGPAPTAAPAVEPAPAPAPAAAPVGSPVDPVRPAPPQAEPGIIGSWLDGLREEFAHPGAAMILLAVLVLAAYANSIWVPFLFDDAPVITRNRLLWQWSTWLDLVKSLPTRSLTNLTFLINFQLAGTPAVQPYFPRDYWSYHVVSMTLHACNGLLLYTLVRDLLRVRGGEAPPGTAPWIALVGAAAWLVHPANTMAVSYIAQRYALMGALAFLGTLVLYVRARMRFEALRDGDDALPAFGLYLAALAASVCCYLTKENAAVIGAAVVLVELFFFKMRRPLLAFAVLGLIIIGAIFRLQTTPIEHYFPSSSPTANTRWDYFTTQIVVTLRYLHLFFMPHDLCVEQSFPVYWDDKSAAIALALAGHALIWSLGGLLFARGHRVIPFAIAWYYLTHIVESSFIPILDPMVDHRMYLTTSMLPPALALAVARAWPWIVARAPADRDQLRRGLTVAVALLLTVEGIGTHVRNRTWASATGIWEDTIEKRPDCARAYSSLGMEHLYVGEWMQSIGPIEAALWLGPYHVEGWNNLGKAYLEIEQWQPAARALERGIEVNQVAPSPSVPLCWNNLGLVHFNLALRAATIPEQKRELEAASYYLEEAIKLDPDYEVALTNLGNASYQLLALADPGPGRAPLAMKTMHALNEAERVATRRGGSLPLAGHRKRALACAEAGNARMAWDLTQQLVGPFAAENPGLVDDAARVAMAVHEQELEARRAQAQQGGSGPSMTAPAAADPSAETKAILAQAAQQLDGLLGREPTRVGSWLLRGQLAELLGDVPGALKAYRTGLALLPADSPEAAGYKARIAKLGG
jgi:tetratricopeptide (TPR) repeat protein